MRRQRDEEADDEQPGPRRAQAGDEARAGADPDDADEDGEADGVEDPERRLGDAPEGRAHRAQPAEDEAHDERPAARREAQRQRRRPSTVSGADEAAEQDAEAQEHDVGLARRALDVAEGAAGALDVALGARRSAAGRHGSRRCRARTGSPRRRATSFSSATPRPCCAASSARVRSASVAAGDHDVERLRPGSRAARGPRPRSSKRPAVREQHVPARGQRPRRRPAWIAVSGSRVDYPGAAAHALDEDAGRGERRLQRPAVRCGTSAASR